MPHSPKDILKLSRFAGTGTKFVPCDLNIEFLGKDKSKMAEALTYVHPRRDFHGFDFYFQVVFRFHHIN